MLWTGVQNFMRNEPSTDTYVSLLLDTCFKVLTLHHCPDELYPLKLQVHIIPLLFSCRVFGEKSNWCRSILEISSVSSETTTLSQGDMGPCPGPGSSVDSGPWFLGMQLEPIQTVLPDPGI